MMDLVVEERSDCLLVVSPSTRTQFTHSLMSSISCTRLLHSEVQLPHLITCFVEFRRQTQAAQKVGPERALAAIRSSHLGARTQMQTPVARASLETRLQSHALDAGSRANSAKGARSPINR